jgi:hypothetical protein
MRAGPAWLAIVLLAASVGCNTRADQCDRLAKAITSARNSARAAVGSSSAKTLDQAIFSLARSKAELTALDLADLQLDRDRLRFVGVLDRYSAALRAFAEVSGNHDAADAEEVMSRMRALAGDERAVVEDIYRDCNIR